MRPRDVFRQNAVSSVRESLLFHQYTDSSASTCHSSTQQRYDDKFTLESSYTVSALPLSEILLSINHLNSTTPISVPLLNIDIEGLDFQVLQSILNDNHVIFDLILLEDKLVCIDPSSSFTPSASNNLLTQHGYKLLSKTPLNSFYVRTNSPLFSWLPSSMLA